jgi:hypothetical protein
MKKVLFAAEQNKYRKNAINTMLKDRKEVEKVVKIAQNIIK